MNRNHPYKKYESLNIWRAVRHELNELIANNDIELTTAPEYVIGSLCKALDEAGQLSGSALAPSE